ncbi:MULTISPECIES: shufflon system plasmid conjugative transfer pilus tip adhesin PilV [Gammaproteobacteria]|uniref:shufflon system plasmid conjugative transfer pilus tip adhesin PilV n=1 Tax=Gammaproteobacteria TaxID=1236 RepID=UPI000DD0DFD3|nr:MULTISPECIES: shufflon system plasmid conjugative transfer pilus tip adhesin PilV [Gammaproteobacteria]RTE87779.1 shufflon system plasmid conjugative transfer pilus tip adhesin PilV [Aliidiomarina sp. B3213]TCZ93331.1 shufflon system plasmid conjugative transfer pilus tip adhesin PilV [Lysobacter sp. N42]
MRAINGFSLLELTISMAILSGLVLVGMQIQSTLHQSKMVQHAAEYMVKLKQEVNRFATLHGHFPEVVTELPNLPNEVPWNLTFNMQQQGETLNVRTQFPSETAAQRVSRLLGSTDISGSTLTFAVQKPVTDVVWDFALYRYPISGRPELNQMQTHLDMNNFDILNVGMLDTTSVQANTLTTNRLNAHTYTSDSLLVRNTATLNQLDVNNLTGEQLTVTNMTTDYAEIQDLLVDELSADELDVHQLTAQQLTVDEVVANSVETQTLEADEIFASDFITPQGSFNDFIQRLDTLEVLWSACVQEGGCQ